MQENIDVLETLRGRGWQILTQRDGLTGAVLHIRCPLNLKRHDFKNWDAVYDFIETAKKGGIDASDIPRRS